MPLWSRQNERRFSGVSSSNCTNVKRGNKKKNIFKKGGLQSVQWKLSPGFKKGSLKNCNLAAGLTEPLFSPTFLQRLSLTVSDRTTLQDEQSPARCPLTRPERHFHATYTRIAPLVPWLFRGGGVERETAERVSCSVTRTCCPGKKQREVRKLRYGAQLWLPPSSGGMTQASNAGSRERTRLAGASAAVGGRRRAEGPTGHTLHSW